jgi:hypothetical protein
MMSGLALAAPRMPITSGVSVSVVLLLWSAVLRLLGAEIVPALGPLLAAEVAALMATVVVVVRQVPGGTAAGLVGLLLACCVAAQVLRPRRPEASGGVVSDVLLPGAVLLGLAVAAGVVLAGTRQ